MGDGHDSDSSSSAVVVRPLKRCRLQQQIESPCFYKDFCRSVDASDVGSESEADGVDFGQLAPPATPACPATPQRTLHLVFAKAAGRVCQPACCELCNFTFRRQLRRAARKEGFAVRSWRIGCLDDWRKLAQHVDKAGGLGQGRGLLCVLMHAWSRDHMDMECLPSWDFYPLLRRLAQQHVLLYPSSPTLDRLHTDKLYRSRWMPPTEYVTFSRARPGAEWSLERAGHTGGGEAFRSDLLAAAKGWLDRLRQSAAAERLTLTDVMVKEGGSWNGQHVRRVRANEADVVAALLDHTLPGQAQGETSAHVMLQAMVPCIAELRWCVLGQGADRLEGRRWLALKTPPRGKRPFDSGRLDRKGCLDALVRSSVVSGEADIPALEESMRPIVAGVLDEARRDNGGEPPHYLRVDMLVCDNGRIWLGERESWGADVYGISRSQVADVLLARGREKLQAVGV